MDPPAPALAPPPHLPDRELFDRLRAAVAMLVAEAPAPSSFLRIAPIVPDHGRLRIQPARLVKAFRTVLDRLPAAAEIDQAMPLLPSPAPSSSSASLGPKGSSAPSSLRR